VPRAPPAAAIPRRRRCRGRTGRTASRRKKGRAREPCIALPRTAGLSSTDRPPRRGSRTHRGAGRAGASSTGTPNRLHAATKSGYPGPLASVQGAINGPSHRPVSTKWAPRTNIWSSYTPLARTSGGTAARSRRLHRVTTAHHRTIRVPSFTRRLGAPDGTHIAYPGGGEIPRLRKASGCFSAGPLGGSRRAGYDGLSRRRLPSWVINVSEVPPDDTVAQSRERNAGSLVQLQQKLSSGWRCDNGAHALLEVRFRVDSPQAPAQPMVGRSDRFTCPPNTQPRQHFASVTPIGGPDELVTCCTGVTVRTFRHSVGRSCWSIWNRRCPLSRPSRWSTA